MRLFNLKIFICPICQRARKFNTLMALNVHLTKKHLTKYTLELPRPKGRPVLRMKRPKPSKNVLK